MVLAQIPRRHYAEHIQNFNVVPYQPRYMLGYSKMMMLINAQYFAKIWAIDHYTDTDSIIFLATLMMWGMYKERLAPPVKTIGGMKWKERRSACHDWR